MNGVGRALWDISVGRPPMISDYLTIDTYRLSRTVLELCGWLKSFRQFHSPARPMTDDKYHHTELSNHRAVTNAV